MARVVTQMDLDLALINQRTAELKQMWKKAEQDAAAVKLGEKMAESIRKAEVEKEARAAAARYVATWDSLLKEKDMGMAMKASTVSEFKAGAQNAARQAAIAAADEWKRIITPAVNESWGMHKAGAGGGMGASPGNARRFAMGNIGMQVQDIAVQAQMGTSPLTIMAQQGSQLASIFGPGGMIVGAVAALGGALLMVGKKGDEAFKEMIKGSADLHTEISRLVEAGSLSEVSALMEKLAEKADELAEARQKLNGGSFWDFAKGSLGTLTGGQGLDQKKYDLQTAERQAAFDVAAANNAALIASERELEVANLKAQGKEKEAEALERQFKLQTEIAKIQNSNFSDETKAKLVENARSISAAEGTEDPDEVEKKWQDAAEKRRSLAKGLADAERSVADAGMNAAQKLVALNEDRLRLEREIAAASTDEDKLKLATERERVEAQIVQSQMSMGKQAQDEEDQRQKRITDMQAEIEQQRVDNLPPAEKAAAIAAALKTTLSSGNAADPTLSGLDAAIGRAGTSEEKERLLKLKKQAQDQQLQLAALAPAPQTQYQQRGAFGQAAAFFSGGNPSELIAVEAQKQTQSLAENNKLLSDIKTTLEQIKGKDGKLVVDEARFRR